MESNKKMSTAGLNGQVAKNLSALYERLYFENDRDAAAAKGDAMQMVSKSLDHAASMLEKGAERPATDADITTPKGYVVIGRMRDTAILFRPNSPYQPFVVAPGYDESDGSWHGNGRYLDNPIDAWKEAAKTVQTPKIVLSGNLDAEDNRHSVGLGVFATNNGLSEGEWDLRILHGEAIIATDFGRGIECSYAERCGEYVKATIAIEEPDCSRHDEMSKVEATFLIDPEFVTGMIAEEA